MAMVRAPGAGGFNPDALLNALNNLTNALDAAGNMQNVMNNLNATLIANNIVLQNRGVHVAQPPHSMEEIRIPLHGSMNLTYPVQQMAGTMLGSFKLSQST